MRANALKKEGQRNILPPQVFNGEKYCGVSHCYYNPLTGYKSGYTKLTQD